MSQSITREVAASLKKGDVLYSNIVEFTREDGTTYPATAKVTGAVREDAYEGFILPIKHKLNGAAGRVTRCNYDLWRTVEEKERKPVRIHRQRPAPAIVEEAAPARVRRTRPVRG